MILADSKTLFRSGIFNCGNFFCLISLLLPVLLQESSRFYYLTLFSVDLFTRKSADMPVETVSKPDRSEDLKNQKNVMDHTVSDIGSIPSQSQEVILASSTTPSRTSWTRIITVISLAALLAPAIYLRSFFQPAELPIDPIDFAARTKRALSQTPLIDGHNDLPYLIRVELRNKIYDGFDLKHKLLGHTDIQRMGAGQVGG